MKENWTWHFTALDGKTIRGARSMTPQECEAAGMVGIASLVFECTDGTIFYAVNPNHPLAASIVIWAGGADSRHDPIAIPPQGDAE